MKKFNPFFIFLIGFCLLLFVDCKAQWQTIQLPGPLYYDLNCIDFINSSTAYVGSDSRIIACKNNFTQNSSDTFRVNIGPVSTIYPATEIRSLHFTNIGNGFVTGNFNIFNEYDILRTADSASTWSFVYTNNQGSMRTFYSFTWSGNKSIACGTAGRIVRSIDGGQTWNPVSSGINNDLKEILYLTPQKLIAVGSNVVILSNDSGSTWTQNGLWSSVDLERISSPGNGIVYTNSSNQIYRSTNYGSIFDTVGNIPSSSIFCVKALSTDTIFAGTNQGLYRSTDSGNHWSFYNSTLNRRINNIEFNSGNIYLLCDSSNLMIASASIEPNASAFASVEVDNQCGVTHLITHNTSDPSLQVSWYINNVLQTNNYDFTKDYFTPAHDTIKLVMSNGTSSDTLTINEYISINPNSVANAGPDIYQCYGQETEFTADSQQYYHWYPETIFNVQNGNYFTRSIRSFALTAPIDIVLITNNSFGCSDTDSVHVDIGLPSTEYFLKTDPNIPDQCGNASCASFTDIDFVSADTGFAVGDFPLFAKTTDQGANWTLLPSGCGIAPVRGGVDFIDGSIGYTGGCGRKTTNGGQTFTVFSQSGDLGDVSFLNADTGIIAAQTNSFDQGMCKVWLTTNAGASTTLIYDYNTWGRFAIYDIKILDVDHIYISGHLNNSSKIKKSIDGGQTWLDITPPVTGSTIIVGIAVVTQDSIFAQCSNGYVFRTIDGGISWKSYWLGSGNSSLDGAIKMINAQVGYLGTWSGKVFKTVNGGDCWQVVAQLDAPSIHAISVLPDGSHVYIASSPDPVTDHPVIYVSQNGPTSIKTLQQNELNISVNPNPFTNYLSINNPLKEILSFQIFNIESQIVYADHLQKDANEFQLSFLTPGIYWGCIHDHLGRIYRFKLIKI